METTTTWLAQTQRRWLFTREEIAGCGGILRGERGEWQRDFSRKIKEQSATAAEYRAIIEGLKFCWTLGIKKLIVD